MKKLQYIFIAVVLLLCAVSCQKDGETFTPSQKTYVSNIGGFVQTESGSPIEGARVTYTTHETLTDENGFYFFNDVQVGDKHNVISVTRYGYFDGSESFRVNHEAKLLLNTRLVRKLFAHTVNAQNLSLSVEDVTLQFPEEGIIVESTGAAYSGDVEVAIRSIGTDEFLMPGDLTSVREDGSVNTLHSYGMVYVELESPEGEKLNIAPNKSVTMRHQIAPEDLGSAPNSISMWWYDYDAGLWIEEGMAIREGDVYIGEVSHFSCWNYDVPEPSIILSGQVLDVNGLNTYFYVKLLNGDGKGGRGGTDYDGYFSGNVEADVPLQISIFPIEECNQNEIPLYTAEIGPFTEDTDIGSLSVEIIAEDVLVLSGTLLDCENDIIENALIKVNNNETYLVQETPFEISIPVCYTGPMIIEVINFEDFTSSTITDIEVPGAYNFNGVSTCDNITDNIMLYDAFPCSAEILNPTVYLNPSFELRNTNVSPEYSRVKVLASGSTSAFPIIVINFKVGGPNTEIAVATYTEEIELQTIKSSISIEVIQEGSFIDVQSIEDINGKTRISGIISVNAIHCSTGLEYTIEGSFLVTEQ